MASYILSNRVCRGLALPLGSTLFFNSGAAGETKVSVNMSISAHAAMGLAAVACLHLGACNRGSARSLPRGSDMAATECRGKEVSGTDVNEDGRADIEHISRNGRRLCSKADMNFDGKTDVVRFYGPDGRTVAHEQHDFDFDGRVDQLSFYEGGELSRKELDTNFDNAIDTWLFCSGGWVVRSERDRRHDGKVDAWETYVEGVIVEASYDENNNGRPDRWDVFRNGRLISTQYDENGDGKPDRTEEMPLQSMGPADDVLRCMQVEVAEVATSPPKDPEAEGSNEESQGVPQ